MSRLLFALLLVFCVLAGAATAQGNAQSQKSLKQLMLVEAEQKRAKTAYEKQRKQKAPGLERARKYYAQASLATGNAYLNADLDSKVKYPKALAYYRECLKVDPGNKNAKASADMIISIYKSMHKPVPGGG